MFAEDNCSCRCADVCGLCYELGASNWLIGTVAAGAAVAAVSWNSVENKVATRMPDKDFPSWMLAEMAASGQSG